MTGQGSTHQILRRMARRTSEPEKARARGALTPDLAIARALARAAQRVLDLQMDAHDTTLHEDLSLAELLDMQEERALLVILEGPGGGLGLFAIGPEVLDAILQKQTTGAVHAESESGRHPTRTDAAMSAPLLERILIEFEIAMSGRSEPAWWAGYRYASFLAEPRSLGLLLEDAGYHALGFAADVADGLRRGRMLLVLPARAAAERGRLSNGDTESACDTAPAPPDTAPPLSELVMQSGARFEAVLCRVNLSMGAVTRLKIGDVVELPSAHLDGVVLDAPGARALAGGRLGQSRGRRAVRLRLPGESGDAADGAGRSSDLSDRRAPQPLAQTEAQSGGQTDAQPATVPVADSAAQELAEPAALPEVGPLPAPMELNPLTEE